MTTNQFQTINISGFPSGYEAACQKMLRNGLRWLQEHPDFDFTTSYHGFRGLYGVVVADNKASKALDKAMIADLDATGAMHQAVVGHLAYIHKNGHEQWIAEIAKKDPTRVFTTTEETIDREIQTAKDEWKAQLASGHNPMLETLKRFATDKEKERQQQ